MSVFGPRRAIFLSLFFCLGLGPLVFGDDECGRGHRRLLYREAVVAGAHGAATASASFDTRLAGPGVRYVLLVRCPQGHRHARVRGHLCPAPVADATITLNGAPVFEAGAGCKRGYLEVPLNPVGGPANTIVTTLAGPPGARIVVAVLALGPSGGTCNTQPTADAGPDQTLPIGARALLDGSGSTDVDGDALTFAWSFAAVPPGSLAALSDPAEVDPSFTIDVPGTYVVQLVVHDGQAASAPDTVAISTGNSPPVADAGPDQAAFVGTPATLDGSGSSDADGDPLTFDWSVRSRPAASVAAISDPAAVRPTLAPDVPGAYELQLVVNDGRSDSAPDTVLVTTQNTAPVADAGADQTVAAGAEVALDGSGSTDVDGDPLTYAWSLTSVPSGSLATLDDPGAVRPRFVADRAGDYVAQLSVDDGLATSVPDTVRVTTENSAPVAEAGPDQTVVAGQLVSLDGTGSSDPDGDPLSFSWSFTSRPAGSAAALLDVMSATPVFTADRPGAYVVQLVVNDGALSSPPDTVTISTTNSAPVADAGPDQAEVTPGAIVALDGSASSDADGHPLTYSWSLLAKPAGSAATLVGETTVLPEFTPDVLGDYVAQLIVNDGLVDSAPDTVTVSTADPAPVVSVTATDAEANEAGSDPGVFTVGRTGPTTDALTVLYGVSGAATNGIDYADLGSSVTIPAGAASATVTVTPIDDVLVEGPENVVLALLPDAAYVVGAPGEATVTIADDPAVVTLSASDPDASEAGADPGTFTLTRSGGDLSQALPVSLAKSGSASTLVDYQSPGGSVATVSIPAGQTSTDVTITPLADNLVEGPETVTFTIVASAGFVISGSVSATVTVADDPPVVSVTATDPDAAEVGPDPGAFAFTRAGGDLAASLLVGFTPGGTASGSDYAPIGSSVTIPPNQTTAPVTITPVPDALVEGDETVVLAVEASSNVAVGTPSSAAVTIVDDPAAVITIVATDATASEAGDTGTFTISRTGSLSGALTVGYAFVGTATNGADFVALPTTLTLSAGAGSATLTVVPIDDPDLESTESVQIQLSPGTGYLVGTPGTAVVTIADDDTLASVIASDSLAGENGADPGAYTVSRLGPSAEPLTVFYTLSGTADAGADYVALPGSVTLAAGATEATVTLEPIDDALLEGPESAVLSLGPGPGYKVGALGAATVTIQDDERPAVSIVVSDGAAGEAGPDPGSFAISRTGPTTGALTVFYDVAGVATQGVDYQALAGSVTIPAGAASAAVTITPIDDGLVEGAELVVLTLRADPAYVAVTPAIAALNIADDDLGVVTIVATDAEASEAGPTTGTFTFSRTGDTSAALVVQVSQAGTAERGSDYAAIGAVTIPAGAPSTALTLSPLADNLVEGDETVVLTIVPNLAYVVGSPSTATVTISDNAPIVSVVASDPDAAEAGLDPGAFVLTRSGGNTAAALTVFLSIGGTTIANRDYVVIGGNASIPAGQTTAALAVTPLRDNLVEAPETVVLTLVPSGAASYLVGSPASATVTIADDPPVVTVVVTDPDAAEAGLDPGTVAFTRTGGDPDAALNVFFTKGGTATNGADYASLGGAVSLVVIPAGQPSASVTIAPLADNLVEGTESAILTLAANSAYVIGGAASGTVTIADDPPVASVTATDPDASEAGPDPGTFTFTRSGGNLAAALSVSFTRGGTATNVSDYLTIPSSVTLTAGQSSATITITPIDDALAEGAETVVLTLNASSVVVVGVPASATVTIADND